MSGYFLCFHVQTRLVFFVGDVRCLKYRCECLQSSGMWFVSFPITLFLQEFKFVDINFISHEEIFHFSVLLDVLCSRSHPWPSFHDLLCDQEAEIRQKFTAKPVPHTQWTRLWMFFYLYRFFSIFFISCHLRLLPGIGSYNAQLLKEKLSLTATSIWFLLLPTSVLPLMITFYSPE